VFGELVIQLIERGFDFAVGMQSGGRTGFGHGTVVKLRDRCKQRFGVVGAKVTPDSFERFKAQVG